MNVSDRMMILSDVLPHCKIVNVFIINDTFYLEACDKVTLNRVNDGSPQMDPLNRSTLLFTQYSHLIWQETYTHLHYFPPRLSSMF